MKNILFRPRIIIVLFIVASFQFSGKSFANPLPDPYSFPFISEVQIADSLTWSIELDRTYLDPSYMGRTIITVIPGSPCTTTRFKLRFSSHPTVYSTSITFDAAGIAVLTRDGITGLLPNEIAPINVSHDTIKIIDTITPYGERGWRLPINSYNPTKSLIATTSYGSYLWNINPNIGIKNSTFFGNAGVQSFEKPFIDEVYATDSLNWKIELDANIYNTMVFNYSADTAIPYPTASELFTLRFSSSAVTYSLRINFDSTGIGVVSRSSITDAPSTQRIALKARRDTILLIDRRIGDCERAFRLPIDTIVNGRSLNYSDCQPYTYPSLVTMRLEKPTIGRRNGTVYKLKLTDSLNSPITNVDLYAYYAPYGSNPTVLGRTLNKNSQIIATLNPCKDADTLWFSTTNEDSLRYVPQRQDTLWIDSCVIAYVDTADTITKTIQLIKKYTTSVKKDPLQKNAPTAANLMVVPLSNHEMSFVVTVNKDVKNVSFQTFTASGQLISNVKIMNDNKKGTFTIPGRSVFSKAAHVTKGVYYCTIIADGKQCAAKTIIVP